MANHEPTNPEGANQLDAKPKMNDEFLTLDKETLKDLEADAERDVKGGFVPSFNCKASIDCGTQPTMACAGHV